MRQIRQGATVTLNNIFFDFDSYAVREESRTELLRIRTFLTDNPSVNITIEGHTDNVGNPAYNRTLSTNRAKAVYDYLIGLGVSAERLAFAGYGAEKPKVSNDTEEGRQQNRRIDFAIQ